LSGTTSTGEARGLALYLFADVRASCERGAGAGASGQVLWAATGQDVMLCSAARHTDRDRAHGRLFVVFLCPLHGSPGVLPRVRACAAVPLPPDEASSLLVRLLGPLVDPRQQTTAPATKQERQVRGSFFHGLFGPSETL
jgi:hypothetical protein